MAFDEVDTYSSLQKQFKLLSLVLHYYAHARRALESGVELDKVLQVPAVAAIARAKRIPEARLEEFDRLNREVERSLAALSPAEAEREKVPSDEEPGKKKEGGSP
jgi:V/A-type H+-transporting ATPase subunit A